MFHSLDKLILNPKDIVYLVWSTGVNTETAIFGDSISNQITQGYFGFGNLSGFTGRTVESVSLQLNTYKYWGDIPVSVFGNIKCILIAETAFPLEILDWWSSFVADIVFNHFQEPLVWTGIILKNAIQSKINEGNPIEFKLHYIIPTSNTDGCGQADGREFRKYDITLTIEFAD